MSGNCRAAQAAKMDEPNSTLSSLSGIKTGRPTIQPVTRAINVKKVSGVTVHRRFVITYDTHIIS